MFGLQLNRRGLLADPKRLGRWGERRSEKFLIKKGFHILGRNFSCKTGEIDLIAVDSDQTIVFVEIKTRADETFAEAESAITSAKKRRLARAARYFLASNNIQDRPYRFDVIAIILGNGKREQIRHYQNAFVP